MEGELKKRKLLAAARKAAAALKLVEFECPRCGGVASVWCYDGTRKAECHACGLRAAEKMNAGKEARAWTPK